ncbi:MAG: nodulation protein NfeD [Bdellovibrionales bacterium]|nr:nodulation protein NfeD [Bdellovibrionales bacterium]
MKRYQSSGVELRHLVVSIFVLFCSHTVALADNAQVAIIRMQMGIFPGTAEFLKESISRAEHEKMSALVVELDTPGGMLQASQDMVKAIFDSSIPVVFYVSPTGGSATSAGVFLTLASHVAVMAPGTSIGAAHPVAGDGQDIQGDMRTKAENMTVAMVKSISERRGRNVQWAEKAVRESESITESQAVKLGVVDFIADDLDGLLRKLKGKEVLIQNEKRTLEDLSKASRVYYEMSLSQTVVNILSNPNIAALLWIGATTGLSLELYHPGAILPGVVGVICLVLALAVYQIIPINISGIVLLVLGVALIGAELAVPSGILGVGGVIAIVLGAIYLIDVNEAPGLTMNMTAIVSAATVCGVALLLAVFAVVRSQRKKITTGSEGLVGSIGEARGNITDDGRIFVHGELWKAFTRSSMIQRGEKVKVLGVHDGLRLEVEKLGDDDSK